HHFSFEFNSVSPTGLKMGLMESNGLKRLRCGLMREGIKGLMKGGRIWLMKGGRIWLMKGGRIWLMKGGIIKSKRFLSGFL
ncbi:hypothetical protein ACLF81_07545, partial [Helicobacter pylori]